MSTAEERDTRYSHRNVPLLNMPPSHKMWIFLVPGPRPHPSPRFHQAHRHWKRLGYWRHRGPHSSHDLQANRAFFAKMRPKLSPVTTVDIYQTTVLPILTYGTEVLVHKDSDLEPLEMGQGLILQQILGLPTKIPKFVTNFLLGILPGKSTVHNRVLKLVSPWHQTCKLDRPVISTDGEPRDIIKRDIGFYKLSDPYSWSSMVSRILTLYDLPSIFSLVE